MNLKVTGPENMGGECRRVSKKFGLKKKKEGTMKVIWPIEAEKGNEEETERVLACRSRRRERRRN